MTALLRSVYAEWTKLRTLPSTFWLLFGTAGLLAGFAGIAAGALNVRECHDGCTEDIVQLTLSGVRLSQVTVAVLGVLAVTAEYGTRTIRPTLAAVPRRWMVLVGKLVVLAGLVAATAATGVGGSLLIGRWLLPHKGFTAANGYHLLSLGDGLTRRAAIGSVLYLVLVVVAAAGIGLLIRDTGAAVGCVFAFLFAGTLAAMFVSDPHWAHRLKRFSPMEAGLAIQSTTHFANLHIGAWAGVGVLAAYAGGLALIGWLLFQLRDA
ncbi:ABC transporter permease [Hamadaea tsunoensis]|uniref:ABC transporter permease n=1 Tax=Hamadaea tsunoensis TaxID=53368 RepID=UPI000413ED5A|nr:ABC transporter permease [Hamadaea tsunoensis]